MLPSDVAWETILSVAAAAIVLIVALLPFGALQLVRGRPIQVCHWRES